MLQTVFQDNGRCSVRYVRMTLTYIECLFSHCWIGCWWKDRLQERQQVSGELTPFESTMAITDSVAVFKFKREGIRIQVPRIEFMTCCYSISYFFSGLLWYERRLYILSECEYNRITLRGGLATINQRLFTSICPRAYGHDCNERIQKGNTFRWA